MKAAYVIDAVRTPRGRGKAGKGALSSVHPQELFAGLLHALSSRNDFVASDVEDVVVGCVTQHGEQGANLARNAVLAASFPDSVTGVTLNRFCGSGLQAVMFGAHGVMSGQQDLVIAGGVESMSRVPMGSDGAGLDGNNERLRARVFQVPQGISADLIATKEGFSRRDLDEFALWSQQKAARARAGGYFEKSLVPVLDAEGSVLLAADEHPRPDTTLESLLRLDPAFARLGAKAAGPNGETLDELALARYPEVAAIQHVHHAGSSSGIVDGAAAVLLASEAYVRRSGLEPRARITATATFGTDPVIMLTAPAPASRKALGKVGMQPKDVDLWEINEAFAAIPLETARRLDVDLERVNVNGGAIALGHPLGATGAILVGTVLDELERRGLMTGVVTLCIGGGMGVAAVIQRDSQP
jgi:acetyl-CoA C-acetyltransferase